jgi:hypothetical protein
MEANAQTYPTAAIRWFLTRRQVTLMLRPLARVMGGRAGVCLQRTSAREAGAVIAEFSE